MSNPVTDLENVRSIVSTGLLVTVAIEENAAVGTLPPVPTNTVAVPVAVL